MSTPIHADTPHDALIKALEKVEDMESVVIIYESKPDEKGKSKAGSFDSDLTVCQALYLMELFRFYLMSSITGDL